MVCSSDSLLQIFKARNKYLFKPNYSYLVTERKCTVHFNTKLHSSFVLCMLTDVKARSSQLSCCSNPAGFQTAGHCLFCGMSSVLLFTLSP